MDRLASLFASLRAGKASGPPTHLLVGLGNPGKEYEGTRHNVGFDALDFLAAQNGADLRQLRFRALCGDADIAGVRTLLMKPGTFMNLSGEAVAEAVSYYHIPPGNLIVLCDDVQFPVGKMRIRRKGTHGGHNGLRNIIERLGTDEFPRIRIGVGKKPHPEYDLSDWVLGHFSPPDRKTLQTLFPDVCAAVALMLDGKTEQAMALYSH